MKEKRFKHQCGATKDGSVRAILNKRRQIFFCFHKTVIIGTIIFVLWFPMQLTLFRKVGKVTAIDFLS